MSRNFANRNGEVPMAFASLHSALISTIASLGLMLAVKPDWANDTVAPFALNLDDE